MGEKIQPVSEDSLRGKEKAKYKPNIAVYNVESRFARNFSTEEDVAKIIFARFGLSFEIVEKKIEGYPKAKAILMNGICIGYITIETLNIRRSTHRYYNVRRITMVREKHNLEGVDLIEASRILSNFTIPS
jgi:hypothetical protein